MSSTYTVRYAPQALDDLRNLYSYVAFSLKEPATAQKLLNRIRKAARSLDALPGRYPIVAVSYTHLQSPARRAVSSAAANSGCTARGQSP